MTFDHRDPDRPPDHEPGCRSSQTAPGRDTREAQRELPAHHVHHDYRAASRKALLSALALLVVALVAETIGGLLARSLALLADAAHLLTDVAAVVLALAAQHFGARPACASRSFGFRRLEILAALVNGVTLWAIAGYILYEALVRLRAPAAVDTLPMLLAAVGGMAVQIAATVVLARAKDESLNVRGAYLHALTDALQSAAVVAVGVAMMITGWWLLDPVVSLLIAAMIAYGGGRIVWEATHVLLEGTPTELDLSAVARQMEATPGVLRVSDLHAWSITTGYNALSAHVVACADVDATGRDGLTRALSTMLRRSFPLQHVTLQVETRCDLACSGWLQATDDDSG